MDIKTGFRVVLTLGAALIAATLLAFIHSQSAFFADTTRSEKLDRLVTEGMQLVQLTNEILLYGGSRADQQWSIQAEEVESLLKSKGVAEDANLQGTINTLSLRLAGLKPVQAKLAEARTKPTPTEIQGILASQLFQDAAHFQESLRSIKAFSDDLLRQAYSHSKERQVTIFTIFAGLVFAYALLATLLFKKTVLNPLFNLGQTILAIREGKKVRAALARNDEIGAVCMAFNTLLEEQADSRREVQKMAKRFRNVFEQAAVGMSLVAPSGEWLEVNQCLCDILGYTREDLLLKNFRILTHPEHIEPDSQRVEALLSGERTHDVWEKRYIRKDGQIIWSRITAAVARNEAGEALYLVNAVEDITKRKQDDARLIEINRQLEEQAKHLKRTNADLESFAYIASHDLREPLRMVSSYIGLIEKRLGPDIDSDMKEFIRFAIDGAKRMDALILGVLDYSLVGRKGEGFKEVALDNVVKEALHNLEVAIQEAGATVTTQENLPAIPGLRSDLVRLFQNLIGNAIKFRQAGRPAIIAVSCKDQGGEWVFAIEDNGIGMDPQYHERVFRIFQRLVAKDKYEGTGIGLSICKKIIEHHNGRIWVESRPGEGSTFFFSLPKLEKKPSSA
jgi:PAS domain S-box-containing protein